MKVGTVTYQDGINFGAYWQAYSLHKVLKFLTKNNNYIINYKNPKHFVTELLVFYHKFYSPKIILENHKKIKKFKDEQKKFTTTNYTINKNSLKRLSFDAIVYGSDEIWNFRNPLFGYDNVYFGYPYNKTKLISYAPSFGSVDSNNSLPLEIINHLKKFKFISVRDENSKKIIKSNLNIDPPIVCDPTFLLDLKTNTTVKENDYILLYCTKLTEQQEEEIIRLKKKTGKKIISVGYDQKIADISYVDIGPNEWLAYYQQSSFVITTMFHGTIFSIKNNKQFVTLSSKYRKNKLNGLLGLFNLKNRIYNENIEILYNAKIDYIKVNKLIHELKVYSLKFLINALNG